MKCEEAKDLIQLYIDSELDCRDTLEVQHHVEQCPSCASLLGALSRQDQHLRKCARAEAIDCRELRERVREEVRRQAIEQSKRGRISPLWRRATTVAATVLIAVLLLLWGWPGAVVNDKVYASAIRDHTLHCTLEKLDRSTKIERDPQKIALLVSEYSNLKNAPDLSLFGFSDLRAKVCKLGEARSIHVVYQHSSEQPLSLFLRPHTDDLKGARVLAATKDGFTVASVIESGFDLVVVSSMDEKRTREIAETIRAQIRSAAQQSN